MICSHPVYLQRLEGTKVVCCYCDQPSVDLMQAQEHYKGRLHLRVLAFLLERQRGSDEPAADFFSLTDGEAAAGGLRWPAG